MVLDTVQTRSKSEPEALREELRVELEGTRAEYLALLDRIPENRWEALVNSKWSARTVMKHIETYLSFVLPRALSNARKGKNMKTPKGAIADTLNSLTAKLISRRKTKDAVRADYEKSHARTLELLAGVRPEEFPLMTDCPGGRMSVEGIFRAHRSHFLHHAAQVEQSLTR